MSLPQSRTHKFIASDVQFSKKQSIIGKNILKYPNISLEHGLVFFAFNCVYNKHLNPEEFKIRYEKLKSVQDILQSLQTKPKYKQKNIKKIEKIKADLKSIQDFFLRPSINNELDYCILYHYIYVILNWKEKEDQPIFNQITEFLNLLEKLKFDQILKKMIIVFRKPEREFCRLLKLFNTKHLGSAGQFSTVFKSWCVQVKNPIDDETFSKIEKRIIDSIQNNYKKRHNN
jgi:hypothetical protein